MADFEFKLQNFGVALKVEGETTRFDQVAPVLDGEVEEREFRKPWTVGEMIDLLLQYPRDMRVLVDGYENGYDDPKEIEIRNVSIDTEWGGGVYGDYHDPKGDAEIANAFNALLIHR